MKKLNTILNIIIGSSIGVFIGRCLYDYWDFKAHPDIYAFYSAPWYTGILLYGAVTAVVVIAALIAKYVVHKIRKH